MTKPVLFLTFNRLDTTKKVFEQIRIAKPPRLYVASDGAREIKEGESQKVQEVRDYILQNIDWKCEVKTRFLQKNSGGCRNGVSGAINWFFENEEDGIILEDDCLPSQSFFTFCEELLNKYKSDKRIWQITGYNVLGNTRIQYSYYFTKIVECWGWATWSDRWKNYNVDLIEYTPSIFDGLSKNKLVKKYWSNILEQMQSEKIDSWAYQWVLVILKNKGLCINPSKNLISNIGFTGVHYDNSQGNTLLNTKTYDIANIIHPEKIEINENFFEKINEVAFDIQNPTFYYYVKKIMSFTVIPVFIRLPKIILKKCNLFNTKKKLVKSSKKNNQIIKDTLK